MKVAANLLFCVPGQVGGSEQYLTRQLSALHRIHGDGPGSAVSLHLMTLPGLIEAHEELAALPHSVAPISGRQRSVRIAAEALWLRRECRRSGNELVHHGGGTVPMRRVGVPEVLTIHDLQYRTYPQSFSPVKLRWLQRAIPQAIERAEVICTPSEFVRDSVIDVGATPDNVVVVPHPLGRVDRDRVATGADELRERFGLRDHVVVFPAITYAHKNHAVLINAMAQLARSDVSLVLIGGRGPREAEVLDLIATRRVGDAVCRAGRVSDADRDGLLAMASALVFPSRYEGFGAPVVEAFARATPVISSGVTALHEVGGDATIVCDPDAPSQWAEAIDQVISDAALADRLRGLGTLRLNDFSDGRAADALLGAYRWAIGA
jgi:glycosyltransferase involved in cell wall biosynthesis